MAAKETINHRESIQLALYRRDYDLMAEHHPDLLDNIEQAIADGVKPDEIKRWAAAVVEESQVVQRCFNAARYIQSQE